MDRQILWDCHMHSSFSADSDTPMKAMIHRAIEMGLQGITFTEHLDPDYPVTPDNLDFLWISRLTKKNWLNFQIYIRIKFSYVSELNWDCKYIWENILIHFSLRHLLISLSVLPILFMDMIPITRNFLRDVRNFYVIWNISNLFLKIFPHTTDLTFTDILIMLSVMVLTRTGNILTDGIKIFWMRF